MKNNVVIGIIILLVIGIVGVGFVAMRQVEPKTMEDDTPNIEAVSPEPEMPSNRKLEGDRASQFNCEQSGGTFTSSNTCDCSKTEYASEYEAETGLCITADGSPAGKLGEDMRTQLELQMKANQ